VVLALPLQVSTDHKDLVWGEDPADPVLDLVNSVRLQPTTDEPAPGQLALLSLDRQDVPDVAGLTGVPVGLWQVDPSASPLSAADLTVRYNDTLINHLGASESSVTLWSYSGDAWQAVDPNSVTLDTSDHLITGVASDFSYFAVTVPPADGVDAAMILAQPMATAAPSVPEPASLGIVTLGATFLLRRRRRVMPRRA